jgi:predicted dehydrogenase
VIRWGIWGTGAIAHQVASDFKLAEGALQHAVASRTADRATRFASAHGAAKSYEGLPALLSDASLDAIYIATPNHRHADDSLACIYAGKAVLCEKPFALNAAQAQRVVDAARKRNVFCMEAMWTRFIPAVIEARRLVKSGAMGPVRLIQGNFAHRMSAGSESRFDHEMGGGALLDLGVYLVSLSYYLLGAPLSVRGSAFLGATGVDEQSGYQLVWESGALADLATSLRTLGSNEFTIFGDTGSIRLSEPFYRAHQLVIGSNPLPQPASPLQERSSPKKIGKAVARVVPGAKALRRRLSPVLALMNRRDTRSFPFPGNGYQFEIMEVNRCIEQRRTESEIMPLDETVAIMQTMDELRSQFGLAYPEEFPVR